MKNETPINHCTATDGKPPVSSSAFVVVIDGWFVGSHSSSKLTFTPHRDNAEQFEKSDATEIKRRVQSGCGTAFLSWNKDDVLILGINEKLPTKQVQTTLF